MSDSFHEKVEQKLSKKKLSASWRSGAEGSEVYEGNGADGTFLVKVKKRETDSYDSLIWSGDRQVDKKSFKTKDQAKQYGEEYVRKYLK